GLGPDRLYDELLQLDRRHARDTAGVLLTALKEDMGDIVAIANTVLVGVAGRHAIAAVVEDAAHQDGGRGFKAGPPRPSGPGKFGLNSLEGGTIDDGGVLARMGLAPVDHLADVEAVLEKMRQRAYAVWTATLATAVRESTDLRHDASTGKFLGERPDRAAFK